MFNKNLIAFVILSVIGTVCLAGTGSSAVVAGTQMQQTNSTCFVEVTKGEDTVYSFNPTWVYNLTTVKRDNTGDAYMVQIRTAEGSYPFEFPNRRAAIAFRDSFTQKAKNCQ